MEQPTTQRKAKHVKKLARFSSVEDMVRLQLMLYCFTNGIHLSEGDYGLLTHIAVYGYDKSKTPQQMVDKGVFLHKQSVRNTRKRMIEMGLLLEEGKHYFLNPSMQIESQGCIWLEFKAINLDTI